MSIGPSPFKGLAAFQDSEQDERLFFGREREREIIVANLLASRLTVLYGDTGVGKSSVLRAGVARDLRVLPEPIAVVVFADWRDDPARALETLVAGETGAEAQGRLADTLELGAALTGGEVVVLLDGLEEEFLYHGDEAGPGSFLDEFSEAATRVGLRASFLLAVREDALAKLDRFKSRVPNVFGNYLRLEHLDRAAGRDAILGPIGRHNESAAAPVAIEPELVEAVLDQVATGKVELAYPLAGQAGRGADNGSQRIEAPYLQLVMARLWEAEDEAGSDALRLQTLARLGGAEQIVRDHLEGALDSLDPDGQDVAAAVFNHLVTPSGTKVAHDASDLAGYAGVSTDEVSPVLEALAAERILRAVPGGTSPRYEIFHDILAEPVLAWRARHESARQLEHVRQDAARRHRRLVVLAVGALVLAGLMAIVTVFAFTQRSEAQSQARRAQARALDASALSLLTTDPGLSLALAVEAAKRDHGGQAESVLREALEASRGRGVIHARGPVNVALYSHDGKRILVAGEDGVARVYDARTLALRFKLRHGAPIVSGGFDPRVTVMFTAGVDGRVVLWSVRDRSRLATFRPGFSVRAASFDHTGDRIAIVGDRSVVVWQLTSRDQSWKQTLPWPVTNAVFSPDGELAVIGNGPQAMLYDVSGRFVRSFDQGSFVRSAAFSPHGAYLVTGGKDATAKIWDARTGRLLSTLVGHSQDVVAIAFSPNGLTVATGSTDGTARTWSVPDGAFKSSFSGHTNAVTSVAFSPDSLELLTASSDRTARVWKNTKTPQVVALLAGHTDAVTEAVWSPNGRRVLTASRDGTARLWEPGQPTLDVLARYPGPVVSAGYVLDGTIAVAGPKESFRLIDDATGKTQHLEDFRAATTALWTGPSEAVVAHGNSVSSLILPALGSLAAARQRVPVTSVALSPGGAYLVTGGTDGVVRVWHDLGHQPIYMRRGHTRAITSVAFSPDDKLFATASKDGTAKIWDFQTGRVLRTLTDHTKPVTSVAFSPDGKLLLTASEDHDARLWSVETGGKVQVLRWHFGTVTDARFSPDGRWIVTAGPQTAQLWQPGVTEPFFQFGIGGPAGQLTSASFDPTSRVIVATSKDGTVRKYDCRICGGLDELLALSRARPTRKLTQAELKKYGG